MDAIAKCERDLALNDELSCELELLSTRLKHSVTPIQIFAWLQNFTDSDRNSALKILGALDFVSEMDLLALLDRSLQSWKANHSGWESAETIFNPIGEYGKSGTLLSYYFKKAPAFKLFADPHRYEFLPSPAALTNMLERDTGTRTFNLVLYDDIVGSGSTIITHLGQFYSRLCDDKRFLSISLIAPFAMEGAIAKIESVLPRLELFPAEVRRKAFGRRQSPFGARATELREVAHRYGQKLYGTPLGHKNAQALVVFPFGCPNNTLPIIWSTKAGWQPLYPRHSTPRIESARAFRQRCAFVLSKAKELGNLAHFVSGSCKTRWSTKQFVTRTDFTLFAVVRLLRQRRDKATVCQIIGMSAGDFDAAILEAQRRGILDDNGALTEAGLREYTLILSRLHAFEGEASGAQEPSDSTAIYVPGTFEGES
ncbi:MAG: phosphoribosyltransferase-like protein [Kiritimatiellia bacterium]